MDLQNVYPYLVPGLIGPAFAETSIPFGHGVYAKLFRDLETEAGIVHSTVSDDALKAAGISPKQAHDVALENLARFAAGPQLSAKMLGGPEHEFHFLLYSGHARAAACLRVPLIHREARHHLGTDELVACVPQRERLIVSPKRDRAYREKLVDKLREIEANARRPISFSLFELTADGVRPFEEE